jgi:hypothetical protein
MRGPYPMAVMVRGQRFETAFACAAHFNVSVGTVRNLVAKGRADSIGLGRGKASIPANRQPLAIGPLRWPSLRAAAEALGYADSRELRRALRSGRHEVLLRRAMQAGCRA